MSKKNWIYLKRGLSKDPQHRRALGNRVWLFMHIIDRANWETGIVTGWKDRDEAADMDMPWRTLQDQRQELEALGYITCIQHFQSLNITVHKWVNPKGYSGQVMNVRGMSPDVDQGTESSVPETTGHGTEKTARHGTGHGTGHRRSKSRTPSIHDHKINDQEGRKDDPVAVFLLALPGYNPANVQRDCQMLAQQGYSVDELPYLWREAQELHDPARGSLIGLFLTMCQNGQHSTRYQTEQIEQQRRAALALKATETNPVNRRPAHHRKQHEASVSPDPTINQPLDQDSSFTPADAWRMAQGELQMQMTRAQFDAWVKPAQLISVNGTWKISVPDAAHREWWETKLKIALQRILTGIVGEPCTPEFVAIVRDVSAKTPGG